MSKDDRSEKCSTWKKLFLGCFEGHFKWTRSHFAQCSVCLWEDTITCSWTPAVQSALRLCPCRQTPFPRHYLLRYRWDDRTIGRMIACDQLILSDTKSEFWNLHTCRGFLFFAETSQHENWKGGKTLEPLFSCLSLVENEKDGLAQNRKVLKAETKPHVQKHIEKQKKRSRRGIQSCPAPRPLRSSRGGVFYSRNSVGLGHGPEMNDENIMK